MLVDETIQFVKERRFFCLEILQRNILHQQQFLESHTELSEPIRISDARCFFPSLFLTQVTQAL